MSEPISKDRGYTQFKQASEGPGFITFAKRISTLKYQHALVNCGQKLLHLVLRTLILGDINDISTCVKNTLKTKYQNSFTKEEQPILEKGVHKKWDICLLFKVIQKICGLPPAGDACWTNDSEHKESLESLITTLKNERNYAVHNFHTVISKDQLEEKLSKLADLAKKLVSALRKRAKELHKKLPDKDSAEIFKIVQTIITDAKRVINESATMPSSQKSAKTDSATSQSREFHGATTSPKEGSPSSSAKSVPATATLPSADPKSVEVENESDEEDDYVERRQYDSISKPGRKPSLEMFEELKKEFWEYAGSVDVV